MTVYKFRPADGRLNDLASRLKAAGHDVIGFDEDTVTMRPFEDISDQPFESWITSMQNHFRCEYSRGVSV